MNSTIDRFFNTDFEEDFRLFALGYSVLIIAFLLSLWLFVSYQALPAIAFAFMLLTLLVIYGFELNLQKKSKLVSAFFLGKLPGFLISIAAGTIIGWLLGALPFSILGTPLAFSTSGASPNVPLSAVPSVNFVYIVLLAPIAETVFFRGWLYPQFTNVFRLLSLPMPAIIALFFVSAVFAIFHYVVYVGDFGLMLGAFVFSMIAGLASVLLKSLGFEFASHGIINFLQEAM